jgi:hypothetical protein
MNLETERVSWKDNHDNVDKFVDSLVEMLMDSEATPAAYMAVDVVFRPYMQWLHNAQTKNVPATLARNSTVHLVNLMLMEMAARMTHRRNGDMAAWLSEFMEDLARELEHDIEALKKAS